MLDYKDRVSYDDAFEALSGLSISHVSFVSDDYNFSTYVNDSNDLKNHINKYVRPGNKKDYVKFLIGEDFDGVSKGVISFYFDIKSKNLKMIGDYNNTEIQKGYEYVDKLIKRCSSETHLHYDTFKQVMRTKWDWTYSRKNSFFNKLKDFIKNV